MDGVKIVLIGDVVKSRIEFNPLQWEKFHESIEKVNEQHGNQMDIPLTVYSGDSFGCICATIEGAVKIILSLQEEQGKHHQSRIVLVEDEIFFGSDKNSFLTLEGPALWKSQKMLEDLKKRDQLFSSSLKKESQTITLNSILGLILLIKKDWKSQVWKIYSASKGNITQSELARSLDVSQQNVSKLMKKFNIKTIQEFEHMLLKQVALFK